MNAESLVARIPDLLITKVPDLHAPSPTVVRLLHLLNDVDADYDEIVTMVSRDPVLSAKLLALCNSAAFGLAMPVASVDQAVLYLGFSEIHRLIMSLGFGSQLAKGLPGYDMEEGALWRHSLVTAFLTPRVLAVSGKAVADTSIAYTAGLIHDIGKLIIGQVIEEDKRARIHELVEKESLSLLQAERAVLGANHAQIGACLLRKWRIPDVIADAVEFHHEPPLSDQPSLAGVIHVADAVAHQSGATPGWSSFAIVLNEPAVASLGLDGADFERLNISAFDLQGKVDEFTKVT